MSLSRHERYPLLFGHSTADGEPVACRVAVPKTMTGNDRPSVPPSHPGRTGGGEVRIPPDAGQRGIDDGGVDADHRVDRPQRTVQWAGIVFA
ncbi:hypothetical protein ACH4UM_30820 [Streptomyces sp. NPDC020801]|uniref:hypothetical protein n=1 Tax=Streptomyces sp. NPDC020801 TaxID=3365093 RepID=UPI0037978A53